MYQPVTQPFPLTRMPQLFLLPLALIALLVGLAESMPLSMARALIQVFGIDLEGVMSLKTSFTFAFVIAAPLLGHYCDRIHRTKLLLPALVVFAASALAMACTSNMAVAIASRVVAGIAAALILPAVLAMVADHTAPARQVAAMGLVMLGMTLGTQLGTMLASALAKPLGWQGPLILLAAGSLGAMLLAARWPASSQQMPQPQRAYGRWALLRALLAMGAWNGIGMLGLVVSGQLKGVEHGFWLEHSLLTALTYIAAMAAGNLAAGAVRRQLRRDEDLVLLAVLLLGVSVAAFALLPPSLPAGMACLGSWGLALGLGAPAGTAVLVSRAGADIAQVLGWSLMLNAVAVLLGMPLCLQLLMRLGTETVLLALVAGVGLGVCLAVADWWATR
ncbi:MFS transporter [Pseudomonas xanthosomatis]|uniref:MFS transporter n=1 Tax=Pseudomonas xanthosomatis TaxID=2842356 RepID=UPI003512C4A3